MRSLRLTIAAVLGIAVGVASARDACDLTMRPIGMVALPEGTQIEGTTFGGISGIDYDPRQNRWYLVSDDRSAGTKLFTAKIDLDAQALRAMTLEAVVTITNPAAIDAESLRFDPWRRRLLVAGEGEAQRGWGPWMGWVDLRGRWRQAWPLPRELAPDARSGPRANRSLEGITFASRKHLFVAMEAPLLQDGEPPNTRMGADVRFTQLTTSGRVVAQYVYRLEPAREHADGESSDNGVSEVLALDDRRLLVLERSGVMHSPTRFTFHTRLYCADVSAATNVLDFATLVGRDYVRATKRLLIDFDTFAGIEVGNLEAMGWGPRLAQHRSLLLATDNNLLPGVATQFIAIEVGSAR